MSTVVVKRPSRRNGPELPSGEIMLDAPPEIPAPGQNRAWMSTITILPMIAGAGAMALMMGGRYNTGGVNSAFGYVVGGLFGVSMLGMMVTQILTQGGQPSKKEMIEQRRDYMRRLAQTRRTIRSNIRDQRQAMFYRHPDPGALWSTVESIRLWERRSSDGDFGVVRVGLGPQEVATPLVPPDVKPVEDLEPVSAQALRRFVTTYSLVPDLPVAMALRGFSRVYVQGEDREAIQPAPVQPHRAAGGRAPRDGDPRRRRHRRLGPPDDGGRGRGRHRDRHDEPAAARVGPQHSRTRDRREREAAQRDHGRRRGGGQARPDQPRRGGVAGPAARPAAAVRGVPRRPADVRRAGPRRAARPGRPVRVGHRKDLGAAAQPRQAAGAGRARPGRSAGRPGHQGVRAGRNGPARPADRRHRIRQVGAAPYAGAGARRQPQLRGAQLRTGRLQGWRDVHHVGPDPAHQRGDHQPGRGTRAGRPDAGRDPG